MGIDRLNTVNKLEKKGPGFFFLEDFPLKEKFIPLLSFLEKEKTFVLKPLFQYPLINTPNSSNKFYI